MDRLPLRNLSRLVLDAVQCLLVAHDYVDEELRSETRDAIDCLRNADMADVEAAATVLRHVAPHLHDVEASLNGANRSLTARKIRDVRQRVLDVTALAAEG
ncbi:MAG TPA: hypothetical protein VHN20_08400 [Beijerinckiaceae bacterium]|nr:hypothetical protein [Beijerinckiaceae bacterium]